MNKINILTGFLIGLLIAFLGSYLYGKLVIGVDIIKYYSVLKQEGVLGKIVALGCVLNIIAVLILLKFRKDTTAKGIILSIILIAFYTMFV